MKIEQVHSMFLEIIDKYGDTRMHDWEFTMNYNLAQQMVFKDHTHNKHKIIAGQRGIGEPIYALEHTEFDTEKFLELVKTNTFGVSASRIINWDAIEDELPEEKEVLVINPYKQKPEVRIENKQAQIYHIMRVGINVDDKVIPSTWSRINDIDRLNDNYFAKATMDKPRHTYENRGIKFYPKEVNNVTITTIQYPRDINFSESNLTLNIDPNTEKSFVVDVLLRMAQNMGVSIRERELYEMGVRLENEQ